MSTFDQGTLEKLKSIDLSKAKHQLITMPLYFVAILFLAGWFGKEKMAGWLGFVTVAQAQTQATAIDNLGQDVRSMRGEYRTDKAYQTIRAMENDLAAHTHTTVDSSAWREKKRKLEGKVKLANEYKDCVLAERTNCELIQRQIWQ